MIRGWTATPDGRHHGAYGAEAARALNAHTGDFLDFSANINPLGPPETALAAATRALEGEAGRYPDLDYPELRAALAGYLGVPSEKVLPTNGGAEALFLAARAARERENVEVRRKALILEPTFSEYAAAARAAGFEPVRMVARRSERDFRLDLAVLDKALNEHAVGLVFLCNPNNPTGDATSCEGVLRAAERVSDVGAALVVDEAFTDFVPEVSVTPEVDGSLFVARSFTKFFAVPGLRLGCLVALDPKRIRAFQPSWSVNAVAAVAGIAAAKDRVYAETTLAEVAQSRAELLGALRTLPRVVAYPGAANFLLVRGPRWLPDELAHRGILVRGCEPFRGLGPEFFRVAVRKKEENERLLEALRSLLDAQLRGGS